MSSTKKWTGVDATGGHVVKVDVTGFGLEGGKASVGDSSPPVETRRETSAQYLTTEQLVSTELPESIGNLAKLEDLRCHYNQLTSEFPRIFPAQRNQYTVSDLMCSRQRACIFVGH